MSLCVTLGIKLAVKNHNLPFDFSVSINPNINFLKKILLLDKYSCFQVIKIASKITFGLIGSMAESKKAYAIGNFAQYDLDHKRFLFFKTKAKTFHK